MSIDLTREDIDALRINKNTVLLLRLPLEMVTEATVRHATDKVKDKVEEHMGVRPTIILVPGETELHSYNLKSLRIIRAEIDQAIQRKEGNFNA